jgi:hypothetical protein
MAFSNPLLFFGFPAHLLNPVSHLLIPSFDGFLFENFRFVKQFVKKNINKISAAIQSAVFIADYRQTPVCGRQGVLRSLALI